MGPCPRKAPPSHEKNLQTTHLNYNKNSFYIKRTKVSCLNSISALLSYNSSPSCSIPQLPRVVQPTKATLLTHFPDLQYSSTNHQPSLHKQDVRPKPRSSISRSREPKTRTVLRAHRLRTRRRRAQRHPRRRGKRRAEEQRAREQSQRTVGGYCPGET